MRYMRYVGSGESNNCPYSHSDLRQSPQLESRPLTPSLLSFSWNPLSDCIRARERQDYLLVQLLLPLRTGKLWLREWRHPQVFSVQVSVLEAGFNIGPLKLWVTLVFVQKVVIFSCPWWPYLHSNMLVLCFRFLLGDKWSLGSFCLLLFPLTTQALSSHPEAAAAAGKKTGQLCVLAASDETVIPDYGKECVYTQTVWFIRSL